MSFNATMAHKFSILFLRSPRLCYKQRVVGDVHSITLQIKIADHETPLPDMDNPMSIKPI